MTHHLANLLSHYGYIAVAVFMIAEGCGIPLPAETMLVTAAAYAARGQLSAWGVVLAGGLGGIIGGSLGYLIGARGGLPFLRQYGRWIRVDDAKITRAQAFFRDRGGRAAFLGRFIALLRMIVPMLAGVTHMQLGRFSAYNAAGALVAALGYTFLGYQFGRDLPALEHHLKLATLALSFLALVAAGAVWVRGKLRQRASPVASNTTA